MATSLLANSRCTVKTMHFIFLSQGEGSPISPTAASSKPVPKSTPSHPVSTSSRQALDPNLMADFQEQAWPPHYVPDSPPSSFRTTPTASAGCSGSAWQASQNDCHCSQPTSAWASSHSHPAVPTPKTKYHPWPNAIMPRFNHLKSNDLSPILLSFGINTGKCLALMPPASGICCLAFFVMNHQPVSQEIETAWRMKSSVFIRIRKNRIPCNRPLA